MAKKKITSELRHCESTDKLSVSRCVSLRYTWLFGLCFFEHAVNELVLLLGSLWSGFLFPIPFPWLYWQLVSERYSETFRVTTAVLECGGHYGSLVPKWCRECGAYWCSDIVWWCQWWWLHWWREGMRWILWGNERMLLGVCRRP